MDDILYFISEFIEKSRQERWNYLASGKWDKFVDKFHGLEKHLNEKCSLVEKNAVERVNEIIEKKRIKRGTYVSLYAQISLMEPLNISKAEDDSLIICKENNIAFFFHHEGWIWICES